MGANEDFEDFARRTGMVSVPPLEPDSMVFNGATMPFMLFAFTEISDDSLQVKSEEND